MESSHSLLSSIFTLLLLFSSSLAQKCEFPAIFNFGDSNSDTGGFSAAFGQAGPPHGESFFGHPAGRYCDGRLVLDFVAEKLGLPYLSAFLDSVGTNFSHGANFATAGSTIRSQNGSLKVGGFSPINLNVQFTEFTNFHIRSQQFYNLGGLYQKVLPKADHFSRALYTFDIGQNDLTAGYFNNKTVDEVKADVPDIVGQLQNVIRGIYGLGGRYFWVHNTGPVGCLPYVLDRFMVRAPEVDKHGCASAFNQVAQHYNKVLKDAVIQLRKELTQAAITYVDVYSLKYSMFANAKKLGFTRSLRACCGHGGKYNYNMNIWCGMKKTIQGKEVYIGRPCEDPSKAVVWDGVHLTQAANEYVFDHIVGGAYSDPPVPLDMACHRME